MLNENIVPISHVGGTGGTFLCHIIVSAKRNIKDVLVNLSEYGNAHWNNLSDISPSGKFGILSSDVDKINYILSKNPNIDASTPYYTVSHIKDIDLINNAFKKSIRITYDIDDIEEIDTVMFGKSEDIDKLKRKKAVSAFKYILEINHTQFTKKENMPNVLFISWKELFKENIDDLIHKLSIFTNINFDNFSKESLVLWRTKTQYCIDTFSLV